MQKTLKFPVLLLLVFLGLQYSAAIADTENKDKDNDLKSEKQKPSYDENITLDEILKKHSDAVGGEEAWDAVETIKFTGSMYTKSATYKTAAIFKRPNLCRIDFQSGRMYFMEAYDGNIPWQMTPAERAVPKVLKGKRASEMIDTCDFEGPLVDHKKKGHEIKYMGVEEVEERPAYLLEVKTRTGNTDLYYLDTETFLPFMVKGKTTIQDKSVNTTIKVGEYIEIGEILIPFSYEFIVDENPDKETMKIKTVQINNEFDHEIFTLPKRPQDLR